MLGTNVFSHMEERVAEYRWAKALEALQKKQPVRFHDASSEWSFDTVLIPLESTGRSKARLAVVAHETTGLYKAMERLQAEKERFRLLYGHAPVPYQSLDAQGRFLEVNQAFRQTLGYESEEILGRPFTDLLPPEWEPHFRENFLRFKAKGRVSGVELELLTKDGRRLWAAFAGVIDYDTKGNVLRTQCVFQDITDRKRAEEGLQQAQRNAERLARTKSDFLATMSHEIRTPLNGLMGMLQLARLADLDEESASCVDMAMDAARSLITIINDVLDLSKVEAGRLELVPEPTELHELMDRVLALFRDQADRKGLRLWWEAAGDVPRRVLTDPGRLRQILLNLVSNAVKFTRKGSVAVLVESCDGSDEPSKTELAVTVADTGPGIPDEAREQLFEPFVQADQEYRERLAGTGLGLSIVRRLTDLFGGRVDVHSEPGLGSAFRITVPVQPLQETPDKPLDDEGLIQEAQQKLQGRRVLVVDDDKVSRLAACGLLDRHGLEARAVDNGRDALEKLRRERFHAVLLDVQMPEMGGLDVVRRIRSGNPDKALADLPVVGLTGHAMPEQRREFLSAGMDECLDKPVDRVRLLRVLCDVLGED
jgi:PAS domain S-box-containing protein